MTEPGCRRVLEGYSPSRLTLAHPLHRCQTCHVTKFTSERTESGGWTFLTNHAHVLLCLAADPYLRVRDVAARVGITERATMRIIADLVDAGYVARQRVGRRTTYRLRLDRPMRHPVEAVRSVRVLVETLADAWRT